VWTSEFGIGKATETNEVEFAGVGDDGTSQIPVTGSATITGDGVAVMIGTGLDMMITPSVGFGASGRWIKGEADNATMDMTMTIGGQTMSQKREIDEASQINMFSVGGGLRLVF
jgi:hypothetical protein